MNKVCLFIINNYKFDKFSFQGFSRSKQTSQWLKKLTQCINNGSSLTGEVGISHEDAQGLEEDIEGPGHASTSKGIQVGSYQYRNKGELNKVSD